MDSPQQHERVQYFIDNGPPRRAILAKRKAIIKDQKVEPGTYFSRELFAIKNRESLLDRVTVRCDVRGLSYIMSSEFWDCLTPLSSFKTDLYYKIHATSLA